MDALTALKQELAHQFSVATDHNRRINKRRELLRAVAGLAVVGSVLTILLLLVAVAFGTYIPGTSDAGDGHAQAKIVISPGQPADWAPASGTAGPGGAAYSSGPADADRHQGVVVAP